MDHAVECIREPQRLLPEMTRKVCRKCTSGKWSPILGAEEEQALQRFLFALDAVEGTLLLLTRLAWTAPLDGSILRSLMLN